MILAYRFRSVIYIVVEVKDMSKEAQKDFNAMLHRENGMPKLQIVTDPAVIAGTAERGCFSRLRWPMMRS